MQVLTYRSSGAWQSMSQDSQAPSQLRPAQEEISRALSDCFRCNNLIVLTGLGTSLHVNVIDPSSYLRQPQAGKKLLQPWGSLAEM